MSELIYDELDIFGQQPGLGIYTQICLCYEVGEDQSSAKIVETLTCGLENLSKAFPWIACKVVNEGSSTSTSNPGIFKFKVLDRTPRLVVKDYTNGSEASWSELEAANFPCRLLDEQWICPIKTLPSDSDGRVFLVQANFVKGGLLLTINAAHNAMDMTGQGQIMRLLSKACHGDRFTTEELNTGNIDRRTVIPLLDDSWEPGAEFDHQRLKPVAIQANAVQSTEPVPHSTPPSPPKVVWAFFSFSGEALKALKSIASETLASGYVSTDDVLSALIWRSVTRARLPRLDPFSECTFARAIDPRRFMGIPNTYPGVVQNMAYSSSPVEKLIQEPLGPAASRLRAQVDLKTSKLGYATSALATMLHRSPNKSIFSVTAALDASKDVMLSSWVKEESYNLDFNLGLGKPKAVRRPRFDPVESLFYLMPKRPDGEIVAMLCLKEEDMARLKEDEEFVKYGKFIG